LQLVEGLDLNCNLSALTVIQSAQSSLDIAVAFSSINSPSTKLINTLRDAAIKRNIKIRLVQPLQTKVKAHFDPWLNILSAASVRNLNVSRLASGKGSSDTHWPFNVNLWIVDKKDFYLGTPLSATYNNQSNPLDALPHLGLYSFNCSCLAEDLTKVFLSLWYLAGLAAIPSHGMANARIIYPATTISPFNRTFPLLLPYKHISLPSQVFFSVSHFFPSIQFIISLK
jgi:hypothetical protein